MSDLDALPYDVTDAGNAIDFTGSACEAPRVVEIGGVRYRVNGFDSGDLWEANQHFRRREAGEEYVSIHYITRGVTQPLFMSIKEEIYS